MRVAVIGADGQLGCDVAPDIYGRAATTCVLLRWMTSGLGRRAPLPSNSRRRVSDLVVNMHYVEQCEHGPRRHSAWMQLETCTSDGRSKPPRPQWTPPCRCRGKPLLVRVCQQNGEVTVARKGEFPAKPRPEYSVLERSALKQHKLNRFRPWQDGLRDYLSAAPIREVAAR